jgi:formate-dependent nitrite reductase membrane component NrfD
MVSRENRIIVACIAAALLLAYGPTMAAFAGVPLGFEYPFWAFWGILVGVGIVLPSLLVGYLDTRHGGGRIS